VKFVPTDLPEVIIVEPDRFGDARGFFLETYHAEKYRAGGIDARFVQDNHSRSVRDCVRGLHAQGRHPQAKLVRVLYGEIFDVAVDIRRGSPTFRRWVGVALSADNLRQCYIPAGFAHGFCVLSDFADVEYKCTDYYDANDELRIQWDDPAIAVRWPLRRPILSEKDKVARPLAELMDALPEYAAKGT